MRVTREERTRHLILLICVCRCVGPQAAGAVVAGRLGVAAAPARCVGCAAVEGLVPSQRPLLLATVAAAAAWTPAVPVCDGSRAQRAAAAVVLVLHVRGVQGWAGLRERCEAGGVPRCPAGMASHSAGVHLATNMPCTGGCGPAQRAGATTARELCSNQLAAATGHVASPLSTTAVRTQYVIDSLERRPAHLKWIERPAGVAALKSARRWVHCYSLSSFMPSKRKFPSVVASYSHLL